jgi:hypothetical protein
VLQCEIDEVASADNVMAASAHPEHDSRVEENYLADLDATVLHLQNSQLGYLAFIVGSHFDDCGGIQQIGGLHK